MQNVYFKRIDDYDNKELINQTCYEMLKKIISDEKIVFNGIVPLKVHFGEPGNVTFITPDNFEGIRKYLKDNDILSYYMDTNVLYKGARTKTEDHIKCALEHGFNDLDIIIADGDDDHPYNEIEINKKHFDKCKIGTKYSEFDNFIILAHFKGHGLAGIGASIKQLAMGFAARGGKLHQHSDSIPIINKNKCIACGRCVDKCPVDAIYLEEKAHINPDICIGCASCTAVCPVNAISNNWDASNFHEKLAEYAYAAALGKKNIYFNFAFNITEDCDCFGTKMKLIAPNIGIFISSDPVAIDAATLAKYEELNTGHDLKAAWKTINYAKDIGLGETDYNLIEL